MMPKKIYLLSIPVMVAALGIFISINYFLKNPGTSHNTESDIAIVIPTVIPSEIPTPSVTSTPEPTLTPTSKPTPIATATPQAMSGPPGTGFSSITVATEKGNFAASVLSLDLSSTKVVTDTANDNDCVTDCTTLSLADFVSRNGGFAGVNGTYFCPSTYPECAGKTNSFDFPVYNSRLSRWINGGNLGWGSRSLVYFDGGGGQYRQNSTDYPGSPQAAIINYPGLVNNGAVQIDDNQSGLSDKQKAKGTKIGIGIRSNTHVMVVVAKNTTMQEFAYVFKSLGATGALNLDSGGSLALYNSGRYIYGPGRALPNAIIFVRR